MDIFAHGLWSAAAAAGAEKKLHRDLRAGWAVWWGVFPDLFAFTIPVTMRIWSTFSGTQQAEAHAGPHTMPRLDLAWQLYQISHSLIVFTLVFAALWLILRRPVVEMGAWALHILIDIPTHTLRFFPTPFLWPVSSYRANGISWGNPWFMACNYGALAIVYFFLLRSQERRETARRAATRIDAVSKAGK